MFYHNIRASQTKEPLVKQADSGWRRGDVAVRYFWMIYELSRIYSVKRLDVIVL